MPGQEEFGSLCVCGCEHFQRVVVERMPGRAITTDFAACVECGCMYYRPLPRNAATHTASGPPMPSGVVGNEAGLLRSWGGVAQSYRRHEQAPDEYKELLERAARANKSKPKR